MIEKRFFESSTTLDGTFWMESGHKSYTINSSVRKKAAFPPNVI